MRRHLEAGKTNDMMLWFTGSTVHALARRVLTRVLTLRNFRIGKSWLSAMPEREWYHIQRIQKEQQKQEVAEKTEERFTPADSVPIVSENDEEDDLDDENKHQQTRIP